MKAMRVSNAAPAKHGRNAFGTKTLLNIGVLPHILALILLYTAIAPAAGAGEPPSRPVFLLTIEGGIGPATTEYIEQGLDEARKNNAALLLLTMDTPGGLMSATRDIVKLILNAPLPVATLVYPQGARAASAGTYILYASHIAAMAPACTTGAATPVQMGSSAPDPQDPSGDPATEEENRQNEDDPIPAREQKVINEAVSFIRELAKKRGRNADWAEKAVRKAATIETSEAREINVIDFIAASPEELLEKADGKTVEVSGQSHILRTAQSTIVTIEPNWRTRLLSVITNPNVAYILLLIGIYGLLLEGYNPGALLPGIAGAISLLLAFYALQILPVNLVGVGLIILGAILMVSEAFAPSFGILGIGGVIALVLGGIFLVDPDIPGFGIDPAFVSAVGVTMGIVFLALTAFLVRARQRPASTGREELIGARGRALSDFRNGRGAVFVRGERWRGSTSRDIKKNEVVRITGIEGLTLMVAPEAEIRENDPKT